MLIDGVKNVDEKSFQREVNLLSQFADENIDVVYKEAYRGLLQQYQLYPLRQAGLQYYQHTLQYKDYAFGTVCGIKFNYPIEKLIKSYNEKNGYDLFLLSGGDIPFKLSALKEKLEEDGISYQRGIGNSLEILIQADDFKQLLRDLTNEQKSNNRK